MQMMHLDYAKKLLDGGYAFGNRFMSCHDDLLVIEDENSYYYGTQLKDGQLQLNADGYVVFERVQIIIDENTRFYLQ